MSATGPIKVYAKDGKWVVNYGSYAHGYHLTRAAAVQTATLAAHYEHRELVVADLSSPSELRTVREALGLADSYARWDAATELVPRWFSSILEAEGSGPRGSASVALLARQGLRITCQFDRSGEAASVTVAEGQPVAVQPGARWAFTRSLEVAIQSVQ